MTKSLGQAQLAEIALANAERRVTEDSRTAYWYYPAKSVSKNPQSLVLIHGYRGNHHGLEAIAGAIEKFDVYIPDLPGFGESKPFSAEHTIDAYADWVNVFLQTLQLKRKPHLLGHSFGSIVVSAYAAKFNGIETLILENPIASPALKGPKAFMTNIARSFFWFAGVLPEQLGDSVLKSWPMVRGMSIIMTKSRETELRRWVHQQHDSNFNDFASRKVALEGYAASISNCVGDYASRIRVPVLMLIGERDDITSVKQQRELYDSLGHTERELTIFPKVGHLTHYEIPADVAESITEWVSNHG